MPALYHREGDRGLQISFDPINHRDLAEQAVSEVVGDVGQTIADSEAQQVQDRWMDLIDQQTSTS